MVQTDQVSRGAQLLLVSANDDTSWLFENNIYVVCVHIRVSSIQFVNSVRSTCNKVVCEMLCCFVCLFVSFILYKVVF
jgi:hypothetical protein